MGEEEKWAIVLWEPGHHCDEFSIVEARGPFSSWEEACQVEEKLEGGEYTVEIVPMKGEKENAHQ